MSKRHRSAKTGRFVTARSANKRPATTVVETHNAQTNSKKTKR
jgi:hypothetical protein